MTITKEEFAKIIGIETGPDINSIRQAVVSKQFQKNKGKRALLLQESYPFLFIGEIVDVVGDFLILNTEITNITELDEYSFRIHLDTIQVFFIEDGKHTIPDIRK